MKKYRTDLCFAALALAATILSGCLGNEDDMQQVDNHDGTRQTITISLSDDNVEKNTRALNNVGNKFFTVNEQIAVVYYNMSGNLVKATSEPLKEDDIVKTEDVQTNAKSAKFTVSLFSPDKARAVHYIYPAAMVNDDGSIITDSIIIQDGTLESVSDQYLCGASWLPWDGEKLPSDITLYDDVSIIKFCTIKDTKGTDITGSITQLNLKNNTQPNICDYYTICREATKGPIYLALYPIYYPSELTITATTQANYYETNVTVENIKAGQCMMMNSEMKLKGIGKFSVNSNGKQVRFAPGNLQALTYRNFMDWKWSFAEQQTSYIGNNIANTNIKGGYYISENGIVDLFGWSTDSGHYGIDELTNDKSYCYTGIFYDWGKLFGIGWRTLTLDEWSYLINSRPDAASKVGFASVDNKCGIILLPDSFIDPLKNKGNGAFVPKTNSSDYQDNVYSDTNWIAMEAAGAVFLPAAGYREGSVVFDDGVVGRYWSASGFDEEHASAVHFNNNSVSVISDGRHYGNSVRLVMNAE